MKELLEDALIIMDDMQPETKGDRKRINFATDNIRIAISMIDNNVIDASRYRYLRDRDLDTIKHGGVFAGKTPDNIVLNGADLDEAIDKALKIVRKE